MKGNDHSEHVVDLSYLTELSKGNTQFVNEMIRIFLEENPGEIELLEKGMRENDFEAIRVSAHKLRSTVPFVGLDKLISKDVTELERLATEYSDTKKIEIEPDNPEIKKIEILTEDKTIKNRMQELFEKIKDTCEKACSELSAHAA